MISGLVGINLSGVVLVLVDVPVERLRTGEDRRGRDYEGGAEHPAGWGRLRLLTDHCGVFLTPGGVQAALSGLAGKL